MNTLRTLIESILIDVIDARFAGDVRAAELAQIYRDDETLRALPIPALNVSGLTVDLRVAFDDNPIQEAEEPSQEQVLAVEEAADRIRRLVMDFASVRTGDVPPRARSGLSRSLNVGVRNVLAETIDRPTAARRRAVEEELEGRLSSHSIGLAEGEKEILRDALGELDMELETIPKPRPKSLPNVIVAAEALKQLDPAMVTSIHFEIDLDGGRWVSVDDSEGGTRSVLSDL